MGCPTMPIVTCPNPSCKKRIKIPDAAQGLFCCPICKCDLGGFSSGRQPLVDTQIARIGGWFTYSVRPLLLELNDPKVAELDADLLGLRRKAEANEADVEVCFLGMAGVGKSSLINALAFGKEMILPTGGVGPLTAQAMTVRYGMTRKLEVEYYSGAELNQVVFALDPSIRSRGNSSTEQGQQPSNSENRESTSERYERMARLLVTGQQDGERNRAQLVDSLRFVLKNDARNDRKPHPDDIDRLVRLRKAIEAKRFEICRTPGNANEFQKALDEHGSGFLAPLVKKAVLYWDSALLKNGIRLVDLPGVGVEGDAHKQVAIDWIRERAKAIVLVVFPKGVQEPEAELLRTTGFLTGLLFAADDPNEDPVMFVLAVSRIDEPAEDSYERSNGSSTMEHCFEEARRHALETRKRELDTHVQHLWAEEGKLSAGRKFAKEQLLNRLQVHAVSPKQYKSVLKKHPFALVNHPDATGIPDLIRGLESLAMERQRWRNALLQADATQFCDQVTSMLRFLRAKSDSELQKTHQSALLRGQLEKFLRPLCDEFTHRQGAFRAFLKEHLPAQLELVVKEACQRAQLSIISKVRSFRSVHANTLKAVVRSLGRFEGSKLEFDLPRDFGLLFEEPLAEAWGQKVLIDIRQRTKRFADDCVELVDQLITWASQTAGIVQTELVQAQRNSLLADARKLEMLGRDGANELRKIVRQRLIKAIAAPIEQECEQFVEEGWNEGPEVRKRVLDMLEKAASKVTNAAGKAALEVLRSCFAHVEKEILDIFANHKNPLTTAAEALLCSQQNELGKQDAVMREQRLQRIRELLAASPCLEFQSDSPSERTA